MTEYPVASSAYEASHVLSTTPCTLYGVYGYNSGAAQFIQLHDAASLPAEGSVPVMPFTAGATSNFSFDFPKRGLKFRNGLVVCNSSTSQTKTIGSADCWFLASIE